MQLSSSSRSAQAWSMFNVITQSYLQPTRFILARAEPHSWQWFSSAIFNSSHPLLTVCYTFHRPQNNGSLCQTRECLRRPPAGHLIMWHRCTVLCYLRFPDRKWYRLAVLALRRHRVRARSHQSDEIHRYASDFNSSRRLRVASTAAVLVRRSKHNDWRPGFSNYDRRREEQSAGRYYVFVHSGHARWSHTLNWFIASSLFIMQLATTVI